MTLVCKSVGIWDGIVNPIYGFEVKMAQDINPTAVATKIRTHLSVVIGVISFKLGY